MGGLGGPFHQVRHYPFGGERWSSGSDLSDFDFTGQRADSFGLLDYRARFYDPLIGRFISADTIVPDFANPQDLNRYSYVRNSPLNFVDPSGHCIPGECPGDLYDNAKFTFVKPSDKFSIYVDQPEAGTSKTFKLTFDNNEPAKIIDLILSRHGKGENVNISGGHTFVAFSDSQTGNTRYYGFYPNGGPVRSDEWMSGHVLDDSNTLKRADVVYEFDITEEGYYNAVRKLETDLLDNPDYHLSENNCTTWVVDLAEVATGQNIPNGYGSW